MLQVRFFRPLLYRVDSRHSLFLYCGGLLRRVSRGGVVVSFEWLRGDSSGFGTAPLPADESRGRCVVKKDSMAETRRRR